MAIQLNSTSPSFKPLLLLLKEDTRVIAKVQQRISPNRAFINIRGHTLLATSSTKIPETGVYKILKEQDKLIFHLVHNTKSTASPKTGSLSFAPIHSQSPLSPELFLRLFSLPLSKNILQSVQHFLFQSGILNKALNQLNQTDKMRLLRQFQKLQSGKGLYFQQDLEEIEQGEVLLMGKKSFQEHGNHSENKQESLWFSLFKDEWDPSQRGNKEVETLVKYFLHLIRLKSNRMRFVPLDQDLGFYCQTGQWAKEGIQYAQFEMLERRSHWHIAGNVLVQKKCLDLKLFASEENGPGMTGELGDLIDRISASLKKRLKFRDVQVDWQAEAGPLKEASLASLLDKLWEDRIDGG